MARGALVRIGRSLEGARGSRGGERKVACYFRFQSRYVRVTPEMARETGFRVSGPDAASLSISISVAKRFVHSFVTEDKPGFPRPMS